MSEGVKLATICLGPSKAAGIEDITLEYADWFDVLPAKMRAELMEKVAEEVQSRAWIERGLADPAKAKASLLDRADDMAGMAARSQTDDDTPTSAG